MTEAATLAGLLVQAAQTERGVRFVRGGDRETRVAYAGLLQRARGLLGHWQRRGLRRGDAVILCVNDNRAFVDAFWACQLGGLVAVPLPAGAQAAAVNRLAAVAQCLEDAWLFGERKLVQRLRQERGDETAFAGRVCLVEEVPADAPPGESPEIHGEDTALIQFSSGSTGAPKGVQLSHANLLANLRAITRAAAIDRGDVTLSWMPLSHDMGLVGFHLVPLYNGLEQVLMDTDLFVRRPARWLELAQRLDATLLCAPNFGYQHYLQRAGEPPPGLDLGRVRLLFSGAEPVSAEVCRAFVQRLADRGLDPAAIFPVYGLAEAGLAVSFPRPGSGVQTCTVSAAALAPGDTVRPPAHNERAIELVFLGAPVDSCELRIVAHGRVPPAGRVGEVQIRGAGVTGGYYNCPACDTDAFDDGWLKTGDLGFTGEHGLVICGRATEVMFFAGQNIYPQDLEQLLVQAGCAEPGKVAVSAVRSADNAEDRLLVCLQYRGEPETFAPHVARVQSALAAQAGLRAGAVIPVPRLPRTTSGKLQRYRLREAFEQGEYAQCLATLSESMSSQQTTQEHSDTEQRLLALCERRFPGRDIQPDQNLFELGADSLTLVSLHEEIDAGFPGRVEITDVFDHPTVRALAAYIDR